MSDEITRRRAKRVLAPWKGADFEPPAIPHSPTFEETYPKLPFAELVRLSLHLAQWLNRIRGGRHSRDSNGFGVRRLAPKPPGGGRTRGAVAPGGVRRAAPPDRQSLGNQPAKALERRSA